VKIIKRLILSIVILLAALLLQAAAAQAKSGLAEAYRSETAPDRHLSERPARPSVRVRASAARTSRPSIARSASFDRGLSSEAGGPRAIPQMDTAKRRTNGEWVGTVTVPEAILPELSRWELSLAPSIATGMLDGLKYLIDYPFG
jgi:hypothetical protein